MNSFKFKVSLEVLKIVTLLFLLCLFSLYVSCITWEQMIFQVMEIHSKQMKCFISFDILFYCMYIFCYPYEEGYILKYCITEICIYKYLIRYYIHDIVLDVTIIMFMVIFYVYNIFYSYINHNHKMK